MIGAVDIGGTKIAVGALREDGVIVHRRDFATEPQRGFADAMERIVSTLRACGPLQGIGLACPGPLDPFTGILGEVGTLPTWTGGSLVASLANQFDVPVAVENDADAAALAEYRWGAGIDSRNFLYITVSTGIGGGILLSGALYRGVAGAHPEIGHLLLDADGPLCYCNARGCWESLASGTAMSTWFYEQSPQRGRLSAAAICALAREGDELARRAVRRQGHYLGLGLASLATFFAPDVIALGGGVMKSSALFLPNALATFRRVCTQVPADLIRIVPSVLGGDAGLLGAAQAWRARHAQSPNTRLPG